MPNENSPQNPSKSVYLITTKESENSIFAESSFVTDDDFLDLLLMEGGFVNHLWESFDNALKEYIESGVSGENKATQSINNINKWWGYNDPYGKNDTTAIVHSYLASKQIDETKKNILTELLTGFKRIEIPSESDNLVLLITHNWYISGICEDSSNFNSDTKFQFIEKLIEIAAKIERVDASSIKLILHDKDIIESGNKDEPLRDNIPDEYSTTCPNLHKAIANRNVRVFIHDPHQAHPSFFKNVLNLNRPICRAVLDEYFNDRTPPEISIIKKIRIVIDISQVKDKYSCSTTEIINAIAEYQSTNEWKLNAVEQNNEYKDVLEKIQQKDSLPILVKGNKSLKELQNEDGRALFLDSSIWIRYVQIGDTQDKNTVQTIVDFFTECQNKGLYKTANAQEVKEFRARLVKNSFFKSFSGSHYKNVTPFVFHSETEMREFIYENRKNSSGKIIDSSSLKAKLSKYSDRAKDSKLDWRLLIVDDNAYQNDNSGVHGKVKKCQIIASVLKNDFYLKCKDSESDSPKCKDCKEWIEEFNKTSKNDKQRLTINLECATDIKEAFDKLTTRRFDLILLDYLLGKNENKNSRDYGTDLLRNLKKQYEDNILIKNRLSKDDTANLEKYILAKGPFGKLWIFFISAFSNAISEQMLSDGMHYDTDYWNIARGACPITTPELFRYNLLSLMDRQLKYITEIGGDDKKYNMTTLADFLVFLFKEPENVRMRTLKYFNSLLHLRVRYDLLKNDYYMGGKENPEALKNGSPLVQSLFPDMDCYSNAFWEHIQHLIYLIAYGNILQWDEMWDEYIFVKENLKRAETHTGIKSMCKQIEDYIIGIKSANFK